MADIELRDIAGVSLDVGLELGRVLQQYAFALEEGNPEGISEAEVALDIFQSSVGEVESSEKVEET